MDSNIMYPGKAKAYASNPSVVHTYEGGRWLTHKLTMKGWNTIDPNKRAPSKKQNT